MVKFGETYEFHKIPEWYNDYINYQVLKKKIEKFKAERKAGNYMKMKGYYSYLHHSRRIVSLGVIDRSEGSI